MLCGAAAAAGEAAGGAVVVHKLRFTDADTSLAVMSGGGRELQFFQFLPEEIVVCLGGGILAGALTGNPALGLGACAITALGSGLVLEIITLVCRAMGPLACTFGGLGLPLGH